MGQAPSPVHAHETKELQLVDQAQQLFLNVRSMRLYVRCSKVLEDVGHLQHELDVYLSRRLNDRFVVSVDYCSSLQEGETCSSSTVLTYFIEQQRSTLLDRTTLPLAQGLTLLLHVLQGFGILYNKFGYFTPNARLVFFNHLQEAKVWLNQDLKITRNVQNPHGPKSVTQENLMVREIVKMFDSLRDPAHPMVSYTQLLPNNLLTFQFAKEALLKKSVEMSCRNVPQKPILVQIQNTRPQSPPTNIKQHPVSYQTSPVKSPVRLQSPRSFKKENPPFLSFTYQSPKPSGIQTPVNGPLSGGSSLEKDGIKIAAKLSLKNASLVTRPSHLLEPSRQFTSTMPNSIRNSGVFERHVIIEKLDPTPTNSRKNSAVEIKISDSQGKKHAAQRYSEAQQHMTKFESKPVPKFLKASLEEHTKQASQVLDRHTDRNSGRAYDQQKTSFNFFQTGEKNQSGPAINDPPLRRDFQGHKRHQTDIKLMERERMRDSDESQRNQISLMQGNYLSKFHLNTIKSIHLLDEDRENDQEIIVDLKHIINKYRRMA